MPFFFSFKNIMLHLANCTVAHVVDGYQIRSHTVFTAVPFISQTGITRVLKSSFTVNCISIKLKIHLFLPLRHDCVFNFCLVCISFIFF